LELSAACAFSVTAFAIALLRAGRTKRKTRAGVLMTRTHPRPKFLGVDDQVTVELDPSLGARYRHYRTGEVLQRRPSASVTRQVTELALLRTRGPAMERCSLRLLANDLTCPTAGHRLHDFSQDEEGVRRAFGERSRVEVASLGADGLPFPSLREALHGRARGH